MKPLLTALKGLTILIVIALTLSGLNLWFKTYLVGNYYLHAGTFLTIMGAAAPIIGLVLAIAACVLIIKFKPENIS